MKVILILSMMALPLSALSQKNETLKEIEFTTGTRGTQKTIRVTADSMYIQKNGLGGDTAIQRPISREEWQHLTNSLEGVSLQELEQLKAPGKKRAFDGAYYSWFTITTQDSSYKSGHFDNHSPHEKLQPLMQQIEQLEARHSRQE